MGSTLLKSDLVVTLDRNDNILNQGYLVIEDDRVVELGYQSDLDSRRKFDQVIELKDRLIMPGLINAHTHVPMTLLRGLADDLRLDVWLLGYMMPVEREFVSPDFVRLGTKIGCAEFIRSGVTSFADMYYFEEDVAKAASEAGLRGLCAQTVLKFPTPDAGSYEDSGTPPLKTSIISGGDVDGFTSDGLIDKPVTIHLPRF